jgi:hypothetical protein
MNFTIIVASGRIEPRFDLFADSISPQLDPSDQVVFVDQFVDYDQKRIRDYKELVDDRFELTHIAPKPNIWTGNHRKTKRSFADISGFRNTGLIVAKHDYIVVVDDLTAVYPNWLNYHRKSAEKGQILCGSFRKVKNLKVLPDGRIHYTDTVVADPRRESQTTDDPVKAGPNWIFGSNVGMPLEYLLKVNGYDEFCARRGAEDGNLGVRLANAGYSDRIHYDKNCAVAEDDGYHYKFANSMYCDLFKYEIPFRRYKTDDKEDQEKGGSIYSQMMDEENEHLYGKKEHTTINQYFDLKAERELYQKSGTFRSVENDTYIDYDGQPIEEL